MNSQGSKEDEDIKHDGQSFAVTDSTAAATAKTSDSTIGTIHLYCLDPTPTCIKYQTLKPTAQISKPI